LDVIGFPIPLCPVSVSCSTTLFYSHKTSSTPNTLTGKQVPRLRAARGPYHRHHGGAHKFRKLPQGGRHCARREVRRWLRVVKPSQRCVVRVGSRPGLWRAVWRAVAVPP
jgi:hypothetical protein